MANTEPVHSGTLAVLDAGALAALDRLVVLSHWNQLACDWQLFAREGRVHVLRDAQARIIASGAVLPMGESDAWISMILVDPAVRGQGLGRRVFSACLQDVEQRGRTAWLDATPAGEALYLQYGFAPLWRLTRWQRQAHAAQSAQARSTPTPVPAPRTLAAGCAGAAVLDRLAALDAQALGFARAAVLQDLAQRAGSSVLEHDGAIAIVRQGRVAQHIGPLLAITEEAASALLQRTAQALGTTLFIDVPDARPLMQAQLTALGFTQQRPFARMRRGTSPTQGPSPIIHAVAGPEYG